MSKSGTTSFRFRYSQFMAKYQHDLKRILHDGKLHLVSKFFQDGTWEFLSPQTRVSFIARCARLKPRDVIHERDAKELRSILDALPTSQEGAPLNQLLQAILDRLPLPSVDPRPSSPTELEPSLVEKSFDPPESFWKETAIPPNPEPAHIREIHEKLLGFTWEEYDHHPFVLNHYAIRLNELAHFYQADERGYAKATQLFRAKAQVLVRLIEKHGRIVELIPEGRTIARVRVGHHHGAGLHLLVRDLPVPLRAQHQVQYRRQLERCPLPVAGTTPPPPSAPNR